MAKMTVIEACLVNYLDGLGAVHEDVGAEVSVNPDVGMELAKAGKAMFSDPAEDPSKGRYLLPEHIRAAAESESKAKAKAKAEAEAKQKAGDGKQ